MRLPDTSELIKLSAKDFHDHNKSYFSHYDHFLLLGRLACDGKKSDQKTLALAVYAWMPTQFERKKESSYFDASILGNVDKCKSWFLENKANIAPISGSWVGTSKFLHFCYPQIFPIWDSIIDRTLTKTKSPKTNSFKKYRNYFELLECKKSEYSVVANHVRSELKNGNLSDVRCIELALFTFGKHHAS